MTDPIADMLTRIRNASSAMHDEVDIPASKIKKNIAQILLSEGYIDAIDPSEDNGHPMLKIRLRYTDER